MEYIKLSGSHLNHILQGTIAKHYNISLKNDRLLYEASALVEL